MEQGLLLLLIWTNPLLSPIYFFNACDTGS